jgi:hypothetical protein
MKEVAPVTGRVAVCRFCTTPIMKDSEKRWIHASSAYSCRNEWGVLMPSSAEPAPVWDPGTLDDEPGRHRSRP